MVSACPRKMQGHWCIHDALKCYYRRLSPSKSIVSGPFPWPIICVAQEDRKSKGSFSGNERNTWETTTGRVQKKALQDPWMGSREVSPTLQLWSHFSWFLMATLQAKVVRCPIETATSPCCTRRTPRPPAAFMPAPAMTGLDGTTSSGQSLSLNRSYWEGAGAERGHSGWSFVPQVHRTSWN